VRPHHDREGGGGGRDDQPAAGRALREQQGEPSRQPSNQPAPVWDVAAHAAPLVRLLTCSMASSHRPPPPLLTLARPALPLCTPPAGPVHGPSTHRGRHPPPDLLMRQPVARGGRQAAVSAAAAAVVAAPRPGKHALIFQPAHRHLACAPLHTGPGSALSFPPIASGMHGRSPAMRVAPNCAFPTQCDCAATYPCPPAPPPFPPTRRAGRGLLAGGAAPDAVPQQCAWLCQLPGAAAGQQAAWRWCCGGGASPLLCIAAGQREAAVPLHRQAQGI